MADKKISELDAITGANTAATDAFVVVDTSTGQTKKITREELNNAIEQDVLSTVDINGGTIDGTTIGGATPAAGSFTTVSATGDISLGDNDKAIFGAGSDLQIFHNAPNGNSIIKEQGGGILTFQTNGSEVSFYDTANAANMARFITGGGVQLYHNGSSRFYTSAGGVNVDGALTVSGDFTVNGTTTTINSTTLEVDDKNIVLASGAADAAAANGSGITIDGASATFTYVSTGDKWQLNKPLDVTGTVTADGLSVDGNITSTGSFTSDGVNITESTFKFDQNGTTLLQGFGASSVSLYFSGSQKLATTSTGIDVTGGIDITSGTTTGLVINHDTFANGLKIIRNDPNNAPSITFENTSGRIGILYANDSDNELKWRPGTTTADYKIWHQANDGSGSGLDADTVDGVQANRIPYALNSSYGSTNTDTAAGGIGSNNIARSMFYRDNATNFGTIGFHAQHATNGDYAWQMASTSYTDASSIQARVKNNGTWTSPVTIWNSGNDGSGSGLDADTVDGIQASSFLRSDANDTSTGTLTLNTGSNQIYLGSDGAIEITRAAGSAYIDFKDSTTEDFDVRLQVSGSGFTVNGNTLWHGGNDGSGSGLDADLLDGQQGSYYRSVSESLFYKSTRETAGSYLNLNAATTPGIYRLHSAGNHTGHPTGSGYGFNIVLDNNDVHGHILLDRLDGGTMHIRAKSGTTWTTSEWNKVWTSGNDGSGSGLDADTVDGLQASSFVRSDADDTMTGNLDINKGASTTLSVRGSGTGTAKIWARGSSQATAMVMVSQDDSHGGGIEYNGDGNPVSTGAGSDYIALFRVSSGTYSWTARNLYANNDWQFRGNVTAYASDERLKENIETIPDALDKVCNLRGVTFDWKDDCEDKGFMPTMQHETGVIAQEVQAVIPDAAVPAPFDEDYLTVKHEKIIPVLIEAIKELKAEVDDLKTQLAEKG